MKEPLSCDCYGGCWGDHSEDWSRVGNTTNAKEFWKAAQKTLQYGTYVYMENHLRLLNPSDAPKLEGIVNA